MTATFLWRIEIRIPAPAREAMEQALETRCISISSFEDANGEDWRVEGFAGAEPDRKALAAELATAARQLGIDPPTPKFDLVPPKNWLAENLTQFPPVRVARYFIHGSHHDGPVPSGAIALKLDPGTAFGSGEHASTAGCLRVLDSLARRHRFRRILDMGCGSGILSLAAARTWRVPVTAADIDEEAARAARSNAAKNHMSPWIKAVCSPGYGSPQVAAGAPYDLIVSNILARPLIKMAGDLSRHLRPAAEGGGMAILSGLVERDGNRVAAAHRAHGFTERRRLVIDGWVTLVLGR